MERITSDDAIKVQTFDGIVLAEFEDNGNGMEGRIFEGNRPGSLEVIRISASDMIAVAAWLLSKAEERARDLEDGDV
jgi:hypothetical protein